MGFDIANIILVVFLVLIIVALIFYIINVQHKITLVDRRVLKIKQNAKYDVSERDLEIKRLNLILENLRKENRTEKSIKLEQNSDNTYGNEINFDVALNDSKAMARLQREIESEKEKFAEKSKRLWEQGIAMRHEKDRIDKLKSEIEKRHKEVTDSIKYAQRIQTAILPEVDLLSVFFSDYFVFWRPKNIVSGDFYWFRKVDNLLVLVVADCTGHGVPGAFVSMLGVSFLNEIVSAGISKTNIKASDIVEDLRTRVKTSLNQTNKEYEQKDGMDLALCIFDFDKMQLQFAGAYNPLYFFRDKELTITKATKNPVGIHIKEVPFENHIIPIQKNDVVYLFSDGYVDQFGGELPGTKFKIAKFGALLANICELDMQQQENLLAANFDDWKGERFQQLDDVIVIGLKI